MPKTLTRGQFKKLRPKGNYSRYLSYIGKHRPPPDPVMERATAMVQASLGPVKAEYDAAAKQRMADALAASRAAQGFTSAFGRAVGDIPNTAGAAYQAAANALSGFAGGLEGRGMEIANTAGAEAAQRVARLSGMDVPMPDAAGAMHTPTQLADISAETFIGRAPGVTNTLNTLDTAGRLSLANWADLQRYEGVQEAAKIRDKYLTELGKRPALIEQAYMALRKDTREQRAMDITAAKMRLDQARLRLDRADSIAERKIAARDVAVAEGELEAKIAGEGYYKKYPPSKGGKTPKEANAKAAKERDEILADIPSSDGIAYARKIVAPDGVFTFGTKNLPRQRLIRLLAAHYWPMLQNYAGPKTKKQLNTKMMNKIVSLVDTLANEYPWLKKNYKAPKPEPSEGGEEPSAGGDPYG